MESSTQFDCEVNAEDVTGSEIHCRLSNVYSAGNVISDIHREMVERYLMQASRTTIFRILAEELEMRKVSA